MTGAAVTVTDRIPYSAVVSPEQAVAYCRRMLPKWTQIVLLAWTDFRDPGDESDLVSVPMYSTHLDYGRRMGELCDALVRLGLAAQPSEVLRAMSQEEGGK